jgi:predicted Co/Zn/Cd cation transporter (cation efflux family)
MSFVLVCRNRNAAIVEPSFDGKTTMRSHNEPLSPSTELSLLTLSTILSFIFGVAGIAFAFLSKSRSVLFDGLYAFVSSFFTLISARVVSLIRRGDTAEYQFGYGAYEPIVIVSRLIFMLCMYSALAVDSVRTILVGGREVVLSMAILYAALSAAVCSIASAVLRRAARKENSPVLIAEARGWRNDALLSLSVLVAFGSVAALESTSLAWLGRYMDSGVTLIIIACMLPSLFALLIANLRELAAAAPSQEIQAQLHAIVERYHEECDFRGFRTYTEKRGRNLYILVYVALKGEAPIRSLDAVRKRMIRDIRQWWHYSDCDVVFTLDPSWIPLSSVQPEEPRIAEEA